MRKFDRVLLVFLFLFVSCSPKQGAGRNTTARQSGGVTRAQVKTLHDIYEDTIKHWTYDLDAYNYANYAEPVERFKFGRGICWDYALYFYKLSQKTGIKNVHFVVSNQMRHAWNELWVNNHVYIIDATWADTNPYADIDDYFMVKASNDKAHFAVDICVVDDTMYQNDISTLYAGNFKADSLRQKYTEKRPIVKLVQRSSEE
jgi:hypothetical protein